MRKFSAILLLGALALMLTVSTSGATPGPDSRVTTINAPDGNTYYLFAYGGSEGPTVDHGIAVYKESNSVGAAACPQWKENLPVGHGVPQASDPFSGLQTAGNTCGVPSDTKLFDTTDHKP